MAHLHEAQAILEQALKGSRNPYVLSSFGKDSLAVLDLCADFGVRRVLYLEDRDEIVDETHRQGIIARYGLEVHRLTSGRAVLYFLQQQPYLLGLPFVSAHVALPVPTNIDPYQPGLPFTCIDDRLRATHGGPLTINPDCIIGGFKRADWDTNTCRIAMDRLSPAAKAEYVASYRPIMEMPFGLRLISPLLEWSHDDVWDYLAERSILASPLMYNGRVRRPYANPVCYRCHDPFGPQLVHCPKTGRHLMNLGAVCGDADAGLYALTRLGLIPGTETTRLQEDAHA